MAPVSSGHASRRRAVSRVSVNPCWRRGVGVGSSAWARPSDWRGRPVVAGVRSERSGRRGGPKQSTSGRCSSSARPSGRRLGRPSGLLYLDSWAEPWRGSRSPRDPGFVNPTGAPEPPGDSSRIVRGFILSCRWVRASAPVGVAPEPLGGSGRTGWGVFYVVSRRGFLRCIGGCAQAHPRV